MSEKQLVDLLPRSSLLLIGTVTHSETPLITGVRDLGGGARRALEPEARRLLLAR